MKPFTKYLLLQLPGWAAALLLLLWLWPRTGWSPWLAVAGFAVFVGKDFLLWPFLRPGYESGVPIGAEQLVGARGVAQGELAPRGWVRVAGELWRAETVGHEGPIPSGSEVRIERASGRTLFVRPAGNG
jgi:membrane protein implicated in regulation of membrane protease activity